MDAKSIKQNLTVDNVKSIMDAFSVPLFKETDNELIYYSICHHSIDFMQHTPKLYYYKASKTWFCHMESQSWDIFSFVQKIKNCSFIDAYNFIIDICHIDTDKLQSNSNIDDWQHELQPFIEHKTPQILKHYDKQLLRLFDDLYWSKWVDEGISVESMQKFNIKWYARNQSVAIPCYDLDGNLIGCRQRFTQAADCEKGKYRPLNTLNEEYKFPCGLSLWGAYQNQDAIRQSKSVILFESEKSILKLDGWGINNCAALYGGNLTVTQVNLLLTLGVENVILALDKQWGEMNKQDKGWVWWKNHISKAANKLHPYMNVEYIFDYNRLTETYDAPCDKGKEVWEKLYSERRKWK